MMRVACALPFFSALIVLTAKASPPPWGLEVLNSDDMYDSTTNTGTCKLSTDVDVEEDVPIPSCQGAVVRVVLENEYRGKCEDYAKNCGSIIDAYLHPGPVRTWPHCCLPVPNRDKTYTIVKHSNYPISVSGCSTTTIDIKYVNATNCRCLNLCEYKRFGDC